MRRLRYPWLKLALALSMAGVAQGQHEPPVQKELRERFGEWADAYPASIPGYTAVESVRQTRFGRGGRAASEREATFQYTLRRAAENPRELVESREPVSAGNGKGARLDASAIGDFSKAALLVTRLATRYHSQMKYFFEPEHPDVTSDLVVIGYRQSDGEGLMEIDGKPVFPHGRAWLDPDDGRVVRMEEEFGDNKIRYWVGVDFAADLATGGWLPTRVTVRLFEKGRLALQNEYTYSSFRPR